jgi:hypothetical protein
MRDSSVLGGTPSVSAAPSEPYTRPRLATSACSICWRWSLGSSLPGRTASEARPGSSRSGRLRTGPRARITARSTTFCSSRMLPGHEYAHSREAERVEPAELREVPRDPVEQRPLRRMRRHHERAELHGTSVGGRRGARAPSAVLDECHGRRAGPGVPPARRSAHPRDRESGNRHARRLPLVDRGEPPRRRRPRAHCVSMCAGGGTGMAMMAMLL